MRNISELQLSRGHSTCTQRHTDAHAYIHSQKGISDLMVQAQIFSGLETESQRLMIGKQPHCYLEAGQAVRPRSPPLLSHFMYIYRSQNSACIFILFSTSVSRKFCCPHREHCPINPTALSQAGGAMPHFSWCSEGNVSCPRVLSFWFLTGTQLCLTALHPWLLSLNLPADVFASRYAPPVSGK